MKKLTDTLGGIKDIFSRQQKSAKNTGAVCVEFKHAACRTRGRTGDGCENYGIHAFEW